MSDVEKFREIVGLHCKNSSSNIVMVVIGEKTK